MLILRNKQLILVVASILIVLAQFAVVVHAAEHPFHHEDAMCLVVQSVEHDKCLSPELFTASPSVILVGEIINTFPEVSTSACNSHYLSRAPPYINV